MKNKPLPPTYFFVCLLLTTGLHFIWPIKQIMPSPYKYLGIILIIIGSWLNYRADQIFKNKQTTVKPYEKSTALIREGPFKFSRHPMYLGMALILLGVAFLLGSVTALIGPIIFIILMKIIFIPVEEKMMEQTFGQEYLDYKNRVRRWL